MKQKFPLLGNTSAIIFMYITVATTLNFPALAYPSHTDNKDGMKLLDNSFSIREQDGESAGLIQRLFNFKRETLLKQDEGISKPDNNKFLSKYRHWYNKPRRKSFTSDSAISDSITQENENSIDKHSQPKYTSNVHSPLSLFRTDLPDVLHIPSTSIKFRSRVRRFASNQQHPKNNPASLRNTDPTFPFAIVSPDGTQAQTWDNGDQAMLSGAEDIARRPSRRGDKFLMYHRSSSMTVQILPDGTVNGVIERNKYCVMIITSTGIVGGERGNTNVILKILGYESGKYLALKENGQIYTTDSPSNPDTDFLHIYKPSVGDFYQSQKHGIYLSFRTNGRPQKSQKVMSKRAQFLVWNASTELKEITPKPTTSTTEEAASESSSLPKKHNNAETNENSQATVSSNKQNTQASTRIPDVNTNLEATNSPAGMTTTVAKKKSESSATATKRRKPRKRICKKGRKKEKGKKMKGKKCRRQRKGKGEKQGKHKGRKRGGKKRKRKGKASKRTERSIQLFLENFSRLRTVESSQRKDADVQWEHRIEFGNPEGAVERQKNENLSPAGTSVAALPTVNARDVT